MNEMLNSFHTTAFQHTVAYLDGGTGSMVIQALFAGVLSAGFIIKSQWAVVKQMIGARKHSNIK